MLHFFFFGFPNVTRISARNMIFRRRNNSIFVLPKRLAAYEELTSSWQVTPVYLPLWWLRVLIFRRVAAVHQKQQQMAITHFSHYVAPSCPHLTNTPHYERLHISVPDLGFCCIKWPRWSLRDEAVIKGEWHWSCKSHNMIKCTASAAI